LRQKFLPRNSIVPEPKKLLQPLQLVRTNWSRRCRILTTTSKRLLEQCKLPSKAFLEGPRVEWQRLDEHLEFRALYTLRGCQLGAMRNCVCRSNISASLRACVITWTRSKYLLWDCSASRRSQVRAGPQSPLGIIRLQDQLAKRLSLGRRMRKTLHSPDYARLLALLRHARKDAGIVRQELADRLGKPQSFVAQNRTRRTAHRCHRIHSHRESDRTRSD
jgi:hypothetical protein